MPQSCSSSEIKISKTLQQMGMCAFDARALVKGLPDKRIFLRTDQGKNYSNERAMHQGAQVYKGKQKTAKMRENTKNCSLPQLDPTQSINLNKDKVPSAMCILIYDNKLITNHVPLKATCFLSKG